ncbi:MAG: hypothetical protein HY829_08130 [Actinobacteria bacterium]|nr:hypothetical protein [Actinomycetota bacterium]
MTRHSDTLVGRSLWRAAVLGGTLLFLATACVSPGSWPRKVSVIPPVTSPTETVAPEEVPPTTQPPAAPEWQEVFMDHFDGAAGTPPGQWHPMTGWNGATLNGSGQLDVGHLSQIRSTPGWSLPVGTQVRVSASLIMPDTGSNYAALWLQHPDAGDPREIDVIESYGPLKAAGAQLGSHLCYDETVDNGVDECGAVGRTAELSGVSDNFADGVKPWQSYWEYHAEFTVGSDRVWFQARDGSGNLAYTAATLPDVRRVPGNVVPFHLRLSNKDVAPDDAVPGGERHSMLVDWVAVQVKYPTAAG